MTWLGVVLGAVASMIIGFVWYSQKVFGSAWMKLIGKSKSDITKEKKKGMWKSLVIDFVASGIVAYALSLGVDYITTFAGLFIAAFSIWFTFIATTMLGTVIWEGKPWKLYFINAGYRLVSILAMTLIVYYI